jgi:hypothetical protein
MKKQNTTVTNSIVKINNEVGRLRFSDCKTHCKATLAMCDD